MEESSISSENGLEINTTPDVPKKKNQLKSKKTPKFIIPKNNTVNDRDNLTPRQGKTRNMSPEQLAK